MFNIRSDLGERDEKKMLLVPSSHVCIYARQWMGVDTHVGVTAYVGLRRTFRHTSKFTLKQGLSISLEFYYVGQAS